MKRLEDIYKDIYEKYLHLHRFVLTSGVPQAHSNPFQTIT